MKALDWGLAACVAAFLLLLLILTGGCSSTQLRTVQALECRVELLEPYLGDLAEELVTEGLRDPNAIVDSLVSLGLTPAEVYSLGTKWRACAGDYAPGPAQVSYEAR